MSGRDGGRWFVATVLLLGSGRSRFLVWIKLHCYEISLKFLGRDTADSEGQERCQKKKSRTGTCDNEDK